VYAPLVINIKDQIFVFMRMMLVKIVKDARPRRKRNGDRSTIGEATLWHKSDRGEIPGIGSQSFGRGLRDRLRSVEASEVWGCGMHILFSGADGSLRDTALSGIGRGIGVGEEVSGGIGDLFRGIFWIRWRRKFFGRWRIAV
jgi:hypothetical protein